MRLFCDPIVLIDGVDKEGCISPSEHFTFSSFFFLHLSVNFAKSVFKHPMLFSGPHNPYHLSLHKDRLNRTRDMLKEMGTSVFSGACTTLGASAFMFFAVLRFFMQFGVFMFCTIGFSLLLKNSGRTFVVILIL
jgi:hypothetical protein